MFMRRCGPIVRRWTVAILGSCGCASPGIHPHSIQMLSMHAARMCSAMEGAAVVSVVRDASTVGWSLGAAFSCICNACIPCVVCISLQRNAWVWWLSRVADYRTSSHTLCVHETVPAHARRRIFISRQNRAFMSGTGGDRGYCCGVPLCATPTLAVGERGFAQERW